MNDVNYIKDQLSSWRKCINWIDKVFPEKEFIIQHELDGLKATTYEERVGGGESNESMRRSKLNDKMNDLIAEKEHCESVIRHCERILNKVQPKYRVVFEYRYKHSSTISYIGFKTGYEGKTVYQIIDRETERIANE
ncbi:hypothetical protein G7062_11350 [Erysipelothrix sp. HDW6C]|uniref:hypothetical protein n=1 Tax=Erysipelothrix sp. HDW6C TaxID=2714930 RepID=UPI001409AAA4|nr:hypothetical protein [Erysipelothrix sp. HDW6C]QIK70853.1 hypothetical protein G7062_11350 [Erysipelothrix sp. HDW6C]